jgi:hypothetical protein
LHEKDSQYLDLAEDYGRLTRLTRDAGFEFCWLDLYCQNIMTNGLEANKAKNFF